MGTPSLIASLKCNETCREQRQRIPMACLTLPAVLATMAALVCCTLTQAQIIDSTYILAVDRRVQEIDAAKDYGIRTLENEEFLEQMTDGGVGN